MSSKGISPVVATVLLMGIAIASVSSAAVFLGDTMQGLQNSVEDWILGESKEESATISVDYGVNGSNGYLLMDIRNTGSISLAVEEGGRKNWNMYVDGVPREWEYVSGSYTGKENVIIDPNEVIRINTTVQFPSTGNRVQVSLKGQYNTGVSYICFSEGGGCES
ncbi:MAG: archaellin/type IV pilin N-terminal domain-containing protein [Candidatus Nanohalobium sp.]